MRRLFYLLILLAFFACNNEDRILEQNDPVSAGNSIAPLSVNADFVKLVDNGTDVAASLKIQSDCSRLKVQWKLPEGCNIDTTASILSVPSGMCELPLKWVKRMSNGSFGPADMAYEGGLIISAEGYSRYIPVYWADEIDSVEISQKLREIHTRAQRGNGDASYAAVVYTLELSPQLLELDKDTCGITYVQSSPEGPVFVDMVDMINTIKVTENYNLDLSDIGILNGGAGQIPFKWVDGKASTESFMGHIKLTKGGLTKYAYFRYEAPAAKEWLFIKSVPADGGYIDAVNGTVEVTVRSNRKWNVSSSLAIHSPISSPDKVEGEQTIKLEIQDNSSTIDRPVTVIVKNVEGDEIQLNFLQRRGPTPIDSDRTNVNDYNDMEEIVIEKEL